MLNPERKSQLDKYTEAVKAIIYDANRMRELMPMLDTRDGAVKAVSAVIGVIEQKAAIPADIKTLLAVNAYVLMVDMAQEIYGEKPDMAMVSQTLMAVVKSVSQPKQTEPQMQQPAQQGLMSGATA